MAFKALAFLVMLCYWPARRPSVSSLIILFSFPLCKIKIMSFLSYRDFARIKWHNTCVVLRTKPGTWEALKTFSSYYHHHHHHCLLFIPLFMFSPLPRIPCLTFYTCQLLLIRQDSVHHCLPQQAFSESLGFSVMQRSILVMPHSLLIHSWLYPNICIFSVFIFPSL